MKIAEYMRVLKPWEPLLACPICKAPMFCRENSVVCGQGHCFDASAKGYLPFAAGSDSLYGEQLFSARATVFEAGMYSPVVEALSACITEYTPSSLSVLDAGCGEGYYLRSLSAVSGTAERTYVGVDLSASGIRRAAKARGPLWCIADLTHLPFRNEVFGGILNILSPACYEEFRRVTVPEGVLIKVIPGPGYLQELRGSAEQEDRNSLQYSATHIRLLHREQLTYTFPLTDALRAALPLMTPLSSQWTQDMRREWAETALPSVTLDLHLLVGLLH